MHLLLTDLVKGEREMCPLIQAPAASLQTLLFFFSFFFSFPLRMENYCPDVKRRIILIAPFSGSRLMLAPRRAQLGLCIHPVSLLISVWREEKPQPFGLGAQLIFPAQQVLVCGQNSPSRESKDQSELSGALKPVVPSDIVLHCQ